MLEAVLLRSLGPENQVRAARLADTLRGLGVPLNALEASVRGSAAGVTGRRMMIERLTADSVGAVFEALEVRMPECVLVAQRAAESLGLSLIAGWDGAGSALKTKLYVNASDGSERIRADLSARLGLSAGSRPHVVGFTVDNTGLELKLYSQFSQCPAAAPELVRDWASAVPLAGVVLSQRQVGGLLTPKAWFVAPRPISFDALRPRLRRFAGWDEHQVGTAVPYAPGQVTSVGFQASSATWTLYFKPLSAPTLSWSLEPSLCVATPEGEVGVFVAPKNHGELAYGTTDRYALSYRLRQGSVNPQDIDLLMEWVMACTRRHERDGIALSFSYPPEPWYVVSFPGP